MSKYITYPPIRLSVPLSSFGRRPAADECSQIREWGSALRPRSTKHWLLVRSGKAEAELFHITRHGKCMWKIPLVPPPEKPRLMSLSDAARAPLQMMF